MPCFNSGWLLYSLLFDWKLTLLIVVTSFSATRSFLFIASFRKNCLLQVISFASSNCQIARTSNSFRTHYGVELTLPLRFHSIRSAFGHVPTLFENAFYVAFDSYTWRFLTVTVGKMHISFIRLEKVRATDKTSFLYLFELFVLNCHVSCKRFPPQLRNAAYGLVSFYWYYPLLLKSYILL